LFLIFSAVYLQSKNKIIMKNIFLIPTERQTNLVRIWYKVEKTAFSFRINAEVNDSYKEYVNIYITDEEELKEGDYIFETDTNIVNTADKDYSRNEFDFKIVLTNDPTLIEDGVQEVSSEFLSFFAENPIDYVRVEKWLDDEGERFYSLDFPPKKETEEKLYTEEEVLKLLLNLPTFENNLHKDQLINKWFAENKK
jgi:hypothetical protein